MVLGGGGGWKYGEHTKNMVVNLPQVSSCYTVYLGFRATHGA